MSRWFDSKEFALIAALAAVVLTAKFWNEIETAAATSVTSVQSAIASLTANADPSPPVTDAEQVIPQQIMVRRCYRPVRYVVAIPSESECAESHCY